LEKRRTMPRPKMQRLWMRHFNKRQPYIYIAAGKRASVKAQEYYCTTLNLLQAPLGTFFRQVLAHPRVQPTGATFADTPLHSLTWRGHLAFIEFATAYFSS